MNFNESRSQELSYLEPLRKKDPSQFDNPTLVENAEFLRKFGIHIPNKESFAQGLIKYYPQDFIVEEIRPDDTICTITRENLAHDTIFPSSQIFHATLVKCNLSTLEAIDELAHILGCQKTQIGYSGIKDKDAITSQRISLKDVSVEKLKQAHSPHFFIKDIVASDTLIKKGILKGNKFSIYVRTEEAFFDQNHSALFIENLTQIKEKGFYNFYYLQRFGAPRYNNSEVGLDILKGNYESAVKRILAQKSDYENRFMTSIRQEIYNKWGDWTTIEKILAPLPVMFKDELFMIRYFIKKQDWRATLQQVLDKVGIISYSVASLFFNEYISMRIAENLPIPNELPLLFSNDTRDIDVYKEFLMALELYPLSFKNVQYFSTVRLQKRLVSTVDHPTIINSSVTDHGVLLSFTLGKGEYATTFLAHLFNLISGTPPSFINKDTVDVKALLADTPAQNTIDHFTPVIQ
ncbi:MAG: tRNA pseudouridine(13) synthase TruD [Candidatus Taylorbacteria bacterium]|nr:tRNA pseudouridine(13) synthase TruD [Candidatus Taylorbacteria bacterium]